jgi:hypothetical protein
VPQVRGSLKDILAGAVFVAFGLAFAIGALTYDVGTPLRMGPGFMPLMVGGLLAALGLAIVVTGFVAGEGEPIGAVDWRALLLITAALLFFGLTVRGLGVIGALFGATLLASLARAATSLREVLVISAGLTALSVLIFIVLLQLRVPLFGTWIPF